VLINSSIASSPRSTILAKISSARPISGITPVSSRVCRQPAPAKLLSRLARTSTSRAGANRGRGRVGPRRRLTRRQLSPVWYERSSRPLARRSRLPRQRRPAPSGRSRGSVDLRPPPRRQLAVLGDPADLTTSSTAQGFDAVATRTPRCATPADEPQQARRYLLKTSRRAPPTPFPRLSALLRMHSEQGGRSKEPGQAAGGKNTKARTSTLSRGGAPGVSGLSNEVWNDNRARPSLALSCTRMNSTSSGCISEK
jgi:hypothetical protein